MGSGSSVHLKCSHCHMTSYGRCDHCRYRYCQQHFHSHAQTCPGARAYQHTTLRCVPECLFCDNDATGRCGGCGKDVCNSCFYSGHRYGQCST
ncbi:unnamed protein product [Rotaria sp. Silwood1]|nr:unnamed protein product [Rotaria sp. Silwood1]